MASYCLLYKNQSSCIVECDYVSRNLGVVHNFLVQDTSLNIRSYYHHIQHFFVLSFICHNLNLICLLIQVSITLCVFIGNIYNIL